MVKQGDIIRLNFSPTAGHEQSGWRPAVVISNDYAIQKTNLVFVCPITNTVRAFAMHVRLDARTKTKGDVLCEQAKAVDLQTRPYSVIESMPEDLLTEVIDIVCACIEPAGT